MGTAPGLFKCSCTDQKEKEQADRQGSKLGDDGKRIVLKKKAESLASLPTFTPLHSQHLPSDDLHQPLLKVTMHLCLTPNCLPVCASCGFSGSGTSPQNLNPGRVSLMVPHGHVSVGKASGHSQA